MNVNVSEMESLLPSEIARLVYGYLEEEGCKDAASAFIKKSSHLKECLFFANKGRKFNSRIHGMNLNDLLELLTEAVSFANEQKRELKVSKAKKKYPLLSSFISENVISSSKKGEQDEDGKEIISEGCDSTISNPPDIRLTGTGHSKNDDVTHPSTKSDEENDVRNSSMASNHGSSHLPTSDIKVKEENTEDCEMMEECVVEPEVEIQAMEGSLPGQVIGRPQMFCQPYPGPVLQLLPAPTVYFPQQILAPHSIPSPITFGSTSIRMATSSNIQSDLTKTITSTSQQSTSGLKLRPIAPKLTQPLSNGVQVVQTKDITPIESTPKSSNRTLRPRKRRKFMAPDPSTCTLFFNDK